MYSSTGTWGYFCFHSAMVAAASSAACEVRQERFVGALLGVEGLFAQALIGSLPHALWLRWKRRGCTGIAAEALPDLGRATHRAPLRVLALAGIREPTAMPAHEIASG